MTQKDLIIKINWNDLNSIKKAERLKASLENKGFKFVKIKKLGINKDILIYEK